MGLTAGADRDGQVRGSGVGLTAGADRVGEAREWSGCKWGCWDAEVYYRILI